MSYGNMVVRRVVLAFVLVVGALAVARALNGSVVPPDYVTLPLIVAGPAVAVALDALVIRPRMRR